MKILSQALHKLQLARLVHLVSRSDANGVPLYRGMNCIYDTIIGGENEIVSTAYWVNEKVDDGEIIDVSEPVQISSDNLSDIKLLHEKLKTNEFALFRKILAKISEQKHL